MVTRHRYLHLSINPPLAACAIPGHAFYKLPLINVMPASWILARFDPLLIPMFPDAVVNFNARADDAEVPTYMTAYL
jgi:hypothetical protein